jgi:hypothetical protein
MLLLLLLEVLLLLLAYQDCLAWCDEPLLLCCVDHAVRNAVFYTARAASSISSSQAVAALRTVHDPLLQQGIQLRHLQ